MANGPSGGFTPPHPEACFLFRVWLCLRLFANCLDLKKKAISIHFNPRAGPFLRPLSAFLLQRLLARTGAAGQAAQQAFY
jgi:hypothetical protein